MVLKSVSSQRKGQNEKLYLGFRPKVRRKTEHRAGSFDMTAIVAALPPQKTNSNSNRMIGCAFTFKQFFCDKCLNNGKKLDWMKFNFTFLYALQCSIKLMFERLEHVGIMRVVCVCRDHRIHESNVTSANSCLLCARPVWILDTNISCWICHFFSIWMTSESLRYTQAVFSWFYCANFKK